MTPRKGTPFLWSYMFTFVRRLDPASDPPRSASRHTPKTCWKNFNICPHCLANRRRGEVERQSEWGPMISRSDGVNFHLVLGDRPIAYPSEPEMMSAGFWYIHEGNHGSTETVVVILRRPPRGVGVALLRDLETVADKLYEKLCTLSRLPSLYEFNGQHLHQISH